MMKVNSMKLFFIVLSIVFTVIMVSAQSPLEGMRDVRALRMNNSETILGVGAHYNSQQGLWFYDLSTDTITGFSVDGNLTRIAWHPDDSKVAVAVANQGYTIYVYELNSNMLMYSIPIETPQFEFLWNDTGSQLALMSNNNIDLLDSNDGSTTVSLTIPSDVVGVLADMEWLSSQNRMFGLLDFESDIVVWDTVTGSIVDTIELPFIVESITLNDTTNQIAAGSAVGDGRIIIIDALSGNIEQDFVGAEGVFIRNMVWSPDNQALAGYTGTNSPREDKLMVWNVSQERVVNIIDVSGFVPSDSLVWLNNNTLIFSSNNSIPLEVSPPMAAAGIDQILTDVDASGSELVTLDGSASSDSDGTIVSYEWLENDVVIATGMTPQVDLTVGVHTITLTVTDDDGATSTDVVTITIDDNTQSCDSTIPISDTASLISAINTGNTEGSSYTICLENSSYTFNTADNSNPLGANALPVITGEITIIGNGATITRDASAPDFRFFRVADGASLMLENLTLNGRDPIDNAGTVRLRAVTLAGDSGGE